MIALVACALALAVVQEVIYLKLNSKGKRNGLHDIYVP
jgi:hypothetical protein